MGKIILYAINVIVLFASCGKEDNPVPAPSVRTIIVYMSADNDLSADAFADIEEMKQGFSGAGTNLIVFIDPVGEAPSILEIAANSERKVKTYPVFNSADASRMIQVLDDIIQMYPANCYGLILWSHGTSWLPAGMQLKSFGEDNRTQMNVSELATALPIRFDFILFDACLMGSVEVAYELKDKTDFIIASSTETIYKGFPYDQIIPELIKPNPDLTQVAANYFNFYAQLSGTYRSATVTLINTKELDNLALITSQIISGQSFDPLSFDRTSVQRLDVYAEQYVFDFWDFIVKAFPDSDKGLLMEQLNKTILYKAHTAMFINEYTIESYCGLSCYIPHPKRNDLNDAYQASSWFIAAGYNNVL